MGSEIVICPVCDGCGINEAGFYPDVDENKGPQKCRACEGRGIILVPETDTTYVPYYPPVEPAIPYPYPPWEPSPTPWIPSPYYPPYKIWCGTTYTTTPCPPTQVYF